MLENELIGSTENEDGAKEIVKTENVNNQNLESFEKQDEVNHKKTFEEIMANRDALKKRQKELEKDKALKKQREKKKSQQKYIRDKDNYFSYYDDIKVGSHKIVDW